MFLRSRVIEEDATHKEKPFANIGIVTGLTRSVKKYLEQKKGEKVTDGEVTAFVASLFGRIDQQLTEEMRGKDSQSPRELLYAKDRAVASVDRHLPSEFKAAVAEVYQADLEERLKVARKRDDVLGAGTFKPTSNMLLRSVYNLHL